MKRTIKIILALLAALLLICSCGNGEKLLESSKDEKTVVKTIDGYEVPMELYRYLALNYKEQYEAGRTSDIWLGESGQALLQQLNEDVNQSLLQLYTTLSVCKAYGLDPESDFIKDTVETSMSEIYEAYEYDYKAYTEALAAVHMNDSVYRFVVRNDILAEELMVLMAQKGEIPTDKETLQSIIESDAFIRVKQILVPFDNGKTKEENLTYAQGVLEKVQNGADFDALASAPGEYGGDLFMFNNPDGYYLCRGQYMKAFEDAAFALGIGEISPIVESSAGYSIIKRYEKDGNYLRAHYDELADEYTSGLYNIALEAHEKTLTVTDTDAMKNYSIFNLMEK